MSDQDYLTISSSRKVPLIEQEPYDDEGCYGYAPLNRWGDCVFTPYRSRWSECGHPMTDWAA